MLDRHGILRERASGSQFLDRFPQQMLDLKHIKQFHNNLMHLEHQMSLKIGHKSLKF